MDDIIGELTKELAGAAEGDLPVPYKRATTDSRFVFRKTDDELLLVYTPDKGAKFVDERLAEHGEEDEELKIRGVFYFRREDVKDIDAPDASKRTFVLGRVMKEHSGYYKVESRVLGIKVNLFIAKGVDVDLGWFEPLYVYDYGSVTVFDKINRVVDEDVFIGGDHERAIPVDSWEKIVAQFPNQRELGHYGDMRVENLIRDYFTVLPDSAKKLDAYVERRKKNALKGRKDEALDSSQRQIGEFEVVKYQYLSERLTELLGDDTLSEKDWEREILKLILLLYPKYVAVLSQMEISENLTKPNGSPTKRFIDLALVDADGHVDLIEIKKPSAGSVLRSGTDHGNYVPSSLLTKAVMQMEKYILYLQKGGYALEKKLNAKYSAQLPGDMKIRVINPKGFLILGRHNFDKQANVDFEVIRRKYANMVDILTYDDMLAYFKNIIAHFKKPATGTEKEA